MRRRPPVSTRTTHWATAPVMADKIREDVAAIVQAAHDVDANARDRDAIARLTAAASRLRVHTAHLLRLASTSQPEVSAAGPGADRPGDRILEGRFPPPWPGGHEINAKMPNEPM